MVQEKCMACKRFLPTTDVAKTRDVATCTVCPGRYHRTCVGIPDKVVVPKDWVCPECKAKEKKTGNICTPVKDICGTSAAPPPIPHTSPEPPQQKETEVCALRRELAEYMAEQREFRVEIRASLKQMGERMDDIERRLEAVEKREAEETPRSGKVDELQQSVARLQLELNDRDQDSLLADLDVGHLPEETGENVVHTFTVLAAKLGVSLEPRDVVFAERVGAPDAAGAGAAGGAGGRPRRIVVRLARRQLRDDLLQAARVRRNFTSADAGRAGAPRRVYVNERLTRTNRQLFHQVREECRKRQWRFAWTKRGRVYARQSDGKQAHNIRSDADIQRVFGGSPI